ncbi:MAG TPA: hypothetical protein VFM02_03105 [Candidatus Paceibacterota bacterium]|nr:hypothetical protein [Candidatus Paceibacterota bacterium]
MLQFADSNRIYISPNFENHIFVEAVVEQLNEFLIRQHLPSTFLRLTRQAKSEHIWDHLPPGSIFESPKVFCILFSIIIEMTKVPADFDVISYVRGKKPNDGVRKPKEKPFVVRARYRPRNTLHWLFDAFLPEGSRVWEKDVFFLSNVGKRKSALDVEEK